MRRILYLLLFPLFMGCDNMLDVEPENAITFTNFFKTEEDFNAALFEMEFFFRYKPFENECMAYRGMQADLITSSSYKDQRMLNQVAIINGTFMNDWGNHYDVLYTANVILDNLHRGEKVSEEMKIFYTGQANFVKGFIYFDLARKWGDAVITRNSTSMEVYARSGVMDVIDEAIRCAGEAYRILPIYEQMPRVGLGSWISKQYGCKGSATALLAHLYAWKGSIIDLCGFVGDAEACYEEATKYCSELIEKKVGFYELEDNVEDICTKAMYGMGRSKETILEFELDETQEYPMAYFPGRIMISWPVEKTGTPSEIKNKDIVLKASTVKKIYETKDLRREEFFFKLDSMSHDTMLVVNDGYAYPYKWRESVYQNVSWSETPQFAYCKANYCYWRLADIYLLRAECYAKLNDDRAVADLNKIRGRAQASLYPAVGETDLQKAIFLERSKELIFEGHRYYDIIRNGLDYIRTYLDGNFKTLTIEDIKEGALYLPVADGAFTLNNVMRQTIYWSRYE